MRATRLLRLAIEKKPKTVLDVGVGHGYHAICFMANGSKVTGLDVKAHPTKIERDRKDYEHIQSAYEEVDLEDKKFDMIWCCHTLEHVPNVQHFLAHLANWLKDDGYLAIAVPPSSQNRIHVGHMTLWTPAHLIYNLICAGWDCRKALWYTEYMTIGLIVQKTKDVNYTAAPGFYGRTGMPTETIWLNQYTPTVINHEDCAWLGDNWHEEVTEVAKDPPHVTLGLQVTTLPPHDFMPFGPNPAFRKEPGIWNK